MRHLLGFSVVPPQTAVAWALPPCSPATCTPTARSCSANRSTQPGAGEEDGAALPGSVPAASEVSETAQGGAECDRARRVLSVIKTLTRMPCEAIN